MVLERKCQQGRQIRNHWFVLFWSAVTNNIFCWIICVTCWLYSLFTRYSSANTTVLGIDSLFKIVQQTNAKHCQLDLPIYWFLLFNMIVKWLPLGLELLTRLKKQLKMSSWALGTCHVHYFVTKISTLFNKCNNHYLQLYINKKV